LNHSIIKIKSHANDRLDAHRLGLCLATKHLMPATCFSLKFEQMIASIKMNIETLRSAGFDQQSCNPSILLTQFDHLYNLALSSNDRG